MYVMYVRSTYINTDMCKYIYIHTLYYKKTSILYQGSLRGQEEEAVWDDRELFTCSTAQKFADTVTNISHHKSYCVDLVHSYYHEPR